MAGCGTQNFSGITQSRFDCLALKAQASGITITGNSGEASKDGVTIRWKFDPAGQTLELECTDAPFLFPCGMINGKIQELVNGC